MSAQVPFPKSHGHRLLLRKNTVFDEDLTIQEPCEFCFECYHDLAFEDYKYNEIQKYCTKCNSVRWYFVIPNDFQQTPTSASETSSIDTSFTPTTASPSAQPLDIASVLLASSNEVTLITSHCSSVPARKRGFHVACKVLDALLTPVYEGSIPHIDGFVIEPFPEDPDYSAGRVMVHARRPEDCWTNLPVGITYMPRGDPLEVCDVPWPTEFVPLGAYEDLSPVVVKPSMPEMYVKHSRSDSGIGLASDEGKVEEQELMAMEMEKEHFLTDCDPGCGLPDGSDYGSDYDMDY